MELTQGMELAQVLKLSPGLLQSMEMLQMNTLELGAYLKELALENPVLEEAEPGQGQDTWEAFASQVPWLGDTPWTGQTAQKGDWGRGESPTESLAFLLEEQLARRGLSPELLAVCRYLAGLLDDDGRLDPEDLAGLRTAGVPAELLERGVEVLQSLEPAELHVEYGLSLDLGKLKPFHEFFLGVVITVPDYPDYLVDIIKGYQITFQDVSSCFGFLLVVDGPSCYHFFLVFEILAYHLPEVEYLRLAVYKGQHYHGKAVLHLSMLIQSVENYIGVGVALKFYYYTHALTV